MFKLIKLLILMVVIVGAGAMFLPLGSVAYKDPQMAGTVIVPSFAVLEKEMTNSEGGYTAEFQTVRTEWALSQEFERMLSEKYVEEVCSDGKRGYFDEANNVILRSYSIEQGVPFSQFVVNYQLGNNC